MDRHWILSLEVELGLDEARPRGHAYNSSLWKAEAGRLSSTLFLGVEWSAAYAPQGKGDNSRPLELMSVLCFAAP